PANVTSFHVTVATVDDALVESSETLIVTLGGVAATGTITDNDVQVVSSVVAEDAAHTGATPVDSTVVEGNSLQYTVTLSAASASATEYTLALSGTAAAGDLGTISFSDGVAWRNGDPTTGVVVVPANVTSFHVTVATVDDALVESSETLIVTLGGVAATGTITDNDVQVVSSVAAEDAAHTGATPVDSVVVEGNSLQYAVTLSAASASTSEYTLAWSGIAAASDLGSITFSNGVAWRNGDATTGVVVVPANVTSFHVTIATVDDVLVESSETLTLTLGGVAATGTITDNDIQVVSSVVAEDAAHMGAAPADRSVVEGNSLQYSVTLSAPSDVAIEYMLTLDGTAAASDLGSISFSDGVVWRNGDPSTGVVVVPAGVTSFHAIIATLDDVLVEASETLTLSVGGVAATGTITDNDVQVVSSVSAEDAAHMGASPIDRSVVEGKSLQYSVTLSAASASASEYALKLSGSANAADLGSISFSDGVAWRNGDPASGIVVVPATVKSFHVLISTIDDTLVEARETLTLTLGGVAATGTITDNDIQAVSSVVAEDAAHTGASPIDRSVVEGNYLLYSVKLNAASDSASEYPLTLGGTAASADLSSISFSDGVAWYGGDPATGMVIVPANVTSFRITVATVDDALVEASETLVLTLGGVAATGTITDNDVQVVSRVLAEDAAHTGATPADRSVVEGNSLQYTVTLSAASASTTEYTLALDGTATAADLGNISFSDGVAWRNGDASKGVLVVPANVTSFHVTIATIDDALLEASETLVLTVGGVAATGTITDNDVQVVSRVLAEDAAHTGATPADRSVVEGNSLQYTVTLSVASASSTEYTLALDGTATAADLGNISFSDGVAWRNGDASKGVLVVPANVTSFHVTIATIDDVLLEASETLVLTVGGVAATGTITDNDVQVVSSVVAGAKVMEGETLNYAVTLNAVSNVATEYALSLSGTADASDYQTLVFSNGVAWLNGDPATAKVVVPAGVGSFVVGVVTVDDKLVEATESLVLQLGGASATGSVDSNDVQPEITPGPVPVVVTPPSPPPVVETPASPPPVVETTPSPQPVPAEYHAVLDPRTDDGKSNTDAVTSVVAPQFTLSSAGYFAEGGTARLTTLDGTVIASQVLTAATVGVGQLNLATTVLDDGVYTFMSQVLDPQGKLVVQAPVSVTIVTDVDGVAPSVELAANGGDFNHDGIPDWQQHAVAQMPLASLADYALGKNAPQTAFGAILAGTPDATSPAGTVKLSDGAQLLDLSVSAAPAPLAANTQAATPMFNFSLKAQDGEQLVDLSSAMPGLQSRVVIDLAPGGVVANDFLKWDKVNQRWYSFLDDGRLDTYDNGATLIDFNGDGKVDRIVVTLTDGGWGDEDGIANGVIVDPGMLVEHVRVATPVFSVLLGNGDRCYTTSAQEAAKLALGKGNVLEGARFDALETALGGHQLNAYFQPYTKDWYYAASGDSMPYACYQSAAGAGFSAAAAGSGVGVDIHLYQNAQGQTQLLSATDAQKLGLTSHGFRDLGAKFSTTTDSAFTFDVEGYLVANRDNTAVQALVKSLASGYHSTSDAGFIEAVEQHYLTQVALVGIAHGGLATAAEVNSVFGTSFGA
ncbi:beta strand repeat-containing protein, partial [Pseudoduganella danionis]